VKDVIARRADGRPRHAEPLDAFADELERLGYRPFRLWWTQTVSELKLSNPSSTPVAVTVLAAALVEGALTFIVKRARANGQFQSKDYERDPRSWKLDDLVASAASGGPAAIIDLQTKARAETLIRTRQRIHAGRMLSDYPAGPPDLRPDEAREARGAAEQVVRAVLDWLQRNPPPSQPSRDTAAGHGSPARVVGYDKQGHGGTARTRLDVGGVSLAYGTEGLARI
jgi:hypothetical protein